MSAASPARVGIGDRARTFAWRAAVLWRFSRPHTIIGTTVSVVALFAIGRAADHPVPLLDLAATLIAAWCVNVAIVGLNQIEDLELDRVNKPRLPLPAGDLSPLAARVIVAAATALPIAMALTQGPIELVAVVAALAVGAAYSSPPLRLKRYPFVAAISIAAVRSLAVNLGVFGHFAGTLAGLPAAVWVLTAVALPFGIAIALLKDVPDVEGDRRFRIRTFSVRLGGRRVLAIAVGLLAATYVAIIAVGAVAVADLDPPLLVAGHLAALAALLAWARRADPGDPAAFTRFYIRVWVLFFCEYVLVAAAFIAAR